MKKQDEKERQMKAERDAMYDETESEDSMTENEYESGDWQKEMTALKSNKTLA